MRVGLAYFQSSDVVALSRHLLGLFLVTSLEGQTTSGMIVETEAYRGPDDKACHAYNNRKTERTSIMYSRGGHAYVYLCYGLHHLFNIVTGPEGIAHAVLVRAIMPVAGEEVMMERRKMTYRDHRLTGGPGRLSQALGISGQHNGIDLTVSPHIWIEERQSTLADLDILRGPRVGVSYAGECAGWLWRFRLKGNAWCSKAQ